MSTDIEEYCRSCQACQLKNSERASERAISIAPSQRPQFQFKQVTIDIIDPIEIPSA